MTDQLSIQITFFNPFRIVPWDKENNRKTNRIYLRGGTYAKWHMTDEDKKTGRPYITGTLLRSALYAELEKILIFHNHKCCPGKDVTDLSGLGKPDFLRKRSRYEFSDIRCTEESPCPLCMIKGEYDNEPSKRKAKRKEKIKNIEWWTVHFSNLRESSNREIFDWNDITVQRIINRIDPVTVKAKDYFAIWEIEPSVCPQFKGIITLNTEKIADKLESVRQLIAVGLAQVNILAGASCRVDIVNHDHNSLIRSYMNITSDQKKEPYPSAVYSEPEYEKDQETDTIARDIANIFGKEEESRLLRRIADVIRELRRESPQIIDRLPKGKPDGQPSVWDKEPKIGTKTLREILKTKAGAVQDEKLWRQFCEELGQAVYDIYAKSPLHDRALPRLLGETEYYGLPPANDEPTCNEFTDKRNIHGYKWIITGQLRAETPFFFGKGDEAIETQKKDEEAKAGHTDKKKNANTKTEQTSKTIVLSREGYFRLPRSVIRGALRSDLRLIIGDGCNMPVGGKKICDCKVCRIMQYVTVEDSGSSCKKPPEIRYRIRLNPHTGTVEEGALFDVETGYQGMIFPFRLNFETRTNNCDPHLFEVLKYWKAGQAVMGGDTGTGLGRFQLDNISFISFFVHKKEQYTPYLLHRTFSGMKPEKILEIFPNEIKTWNSEKSPIPVPSSEEIPPNKLPWIEVSYIISVISPLISRDPIGAMFDSRSADAIMIRKGVFEPDGNGGNLPEPEYRYFIKSESIRGILRSILAGTKNEKGEFLCDIDHEDCDCMQCRLFGSVHHRGKLRFEDAEIKDVATDKKMDHVAIDRFTGGSADKMKFDDYPLTACPDNPLVLKGIFWVCDDLSKEEKQALENVLAEFGTGRAAIGGLGAIGYGQIGKFELVSGHEFLQLPPKESVPTESGERYKFGHDPATSINNSHIYHPHYFLKPSNKVVDRERTLISHARKEEDKFTGKISCRLITKGPIFTPDTGNDDYFGLQEKYPKHKNYGFFRINGKPAIPGSSIRGMVSSVFEALTNSCFRVLDQEKYLTRRIKAEKEEELKNFLPGRVTGDGRNIRKLSEIFRLPLYDVEDIRPFLSDKYNPAKYSSRNYADKIKDAIEFNKEMAKYAKQNQEFLKKYKNISDVLKGEEPIWFRIDNPTPKTKKNQPKNPNSKIAVLVNKGTQGAKKGYIKFTGPCMVNVNSEPKDKTISNCKLSDSEKWNIACIHNRVEERESLNKKYPRPCLKCIHDEVEYTMIKRCEHVFSDSSSDEVYRVPQKVVSQYNAIIEDNRSNTKHIPDFFKSCLLHEHLSDGDLVYFKVDEAETTVTEIIPVRISRKTDNLPMAKRFENESLRPCHHICIENCEECPQLCDQVKDYFKPHPDGLCPACHLFGTPYYKGRVGFGMAWLDGKPEWYSPSPQFHPAKAEGDLLTLPLLERPRPTWSVPNSDAKIPGRKFYIHHPWSVGGIGKDFDKDKNKPNENNRTVEPLAAGNEFVFDVNFHNLRDWELGLLMYSLELEDNLAHKFGMGKAVGLGSVQIKIESITFDKNRENETYPDKISLIRKGFEILGITNPQDTLPEYIGQLRNLLWLPPESTSAMVRYPSLKGEKDDKGKIITPGYTDFIEKPDEKKTENSSYYMLPESRVRMLRTPWEMWFKNKEKGTVRWFDEKKGFGFIERENGKGDLFVHKNSLLGKIPIEGQKVRFKETKGKKGPAATDVEIDVEA